MFIINWGPEALHASCILSPAAPGASSVAGYATLKHATLAQELL